MNKVGFFILVAAIILGCTKSPISIPEANSERASGESTDIIKEWQNDLPLDTAVSTFSGKELLEHLKGLSEYMEKASKNIQLRPIENIEELPSRDVRIESIDDIYFYHKFVERQHNLDSDFSSSGHSTLPFQKLSMMALQIHFIQMNINAQRYKKSDNNAST